jgi:MFS family permease
LAQPGFSRLFAVRLAGQFGDGVFQASLAGAVLFSPDRQAHASDVAAGFAVLLLPYSVIGPFAGVLLDRWWRQRVLVLANLFRAVAVLVVAAEVAAGFEGIAFYATALVVVSLSRFFNSALSASLPHVVQSDDLVTANALTTTVGSVATTVGGAAALGVRALIGSSNHAYAVLSLASVVPYVLSALYARGFDRSVLGPDEAERRARESVADVARGLAAGAAYVRDRRPALYALGAIGVHRLCFGLWTVMTLLLYRNYFHSDGLLRAGLAGLTQVVAVVAIGGGLAALVTPNLVRRLGYARWPARLLLGSGIVVVVSTLPYALPIALAGALLLGFASQGIKICVDTIVQTYVEDDYRGRVFALYDTVFNVALVFAAVLTALVMPEDGHAPIMVVAIGVAYLACAVGYQLLATRAGTTVSPTARSTSA